MQKILKPRYLLFFILLAITLVTAGCNDGGSKAGAPVAIEAYLQALVAKDLNQTINHSCAAWEKRAQEEVQSFAAENVSIEELDCQAGGEADGFSLVSCSGRIIADYGAEDLVIDLNEFTYRAIEEGGEWRMCGYQ
ncbi:hypothetical protein ACFLZW_00255 [Chloroflexota bacterium]